MLRSNANYTTAKRPEVAEQAALKGMKSCPKNHMLQDVVTKVDGYVPVGIFVHILLIGIDAIRVENPLALFRRVH
jgi:hypothetical protein